MVKGPPQGRVLGAPPLPSQHSTTSARPETAGPYPKLIGPDVEKRGFFFSPDPEQSQNGAFAVHQVGHRMFASHRQKIFDCDILLEQVARFQRMAGLIYQIIYRRSAPIKFNCLSETILAQHSRSVQFLPLDSVISAR